MSLARTVISVAEVDHFLPMAEREASLLPRTLMPSISRGGFIPPGKGCCHASVADRSSHAFVAEAHKFAVPIGGRHPNFKLNLGVLRGPGDSGDPAKLWKVPRGDEGEPSAGPAAGRGVGKVSVPAATVRAIVIVVSGRESEETLSQVVAAVRTEGIGSLPGAKIHFPIKQIRFTEISAGSKSRL
jgi:hypothetical protein